METNINTNAETKQSDLDNVKSHWAKHKMKYITVGALILAGGIGYHFGNRGNSKHHYTKLLKDGVSDSVKEGMRDVVRDDMKDVVKSGMKDVITHAVNDAVDDAVRSNIRKAVGDTVRNVIENSAVTIVKEVEPKGPSDADMQKVVAAILKSMDGVTIRTDENGTAYVAKQTV